MAAKTRYAKSGDVNIAFQVVGDGPIDLVLSVGWVTHLDLAWDIPPLVRFYERLASFSRLILFDKRGTGLSDPVTGGSLPTLEERMDDIRAVLDDAGSKRAAVMGESEGGPLAMLFAAAHPERTVALILQGAEVRERTDEDWPWGEATEAEFEEAMASLPERWGQGRGFQVFVPSMGDVEWGREWLGRVQVHSNTPGGAEAFMRMAFDIDVRDVVSAINVPTLVIHAVEDQVCHVENARFLARTITGARYLELPGGDHAPWFDPDQTIAEIREFLTGTREASAHDRMLATVLFTDLVGSTALTVELGDQRWRDLVEQHHAAVRRELGRYDGREVDTAGDGFFATFDGPARAIRCAQAIVGAVRPLGLAVRAGLHTGEVEVADGKVAGIAVNIGARVAARAESGEVLVSSTVRDLVAGSGLEFAERGQAELKGVPGEWRLFAVAF